jgi:hypothetical protein
MGWRGFRTLSATALLTLLVACGSQTTAQPTAPVGGQHAKRPARYALYTHCGITWAKIRGTFWRAREPSSDGDGNPPPGWGNPYQIGTLELIGAKTPVFRSPAGQVTFDRTPRTTAPSICS